MSARDALITSVTGLVRRRGVAGTGLNALLEDSGVARRTVYLNFPGGKAELVAEATVTQMEAGCPIVAAILGRAEAPAAARAAAEAFAEWQVILTDRLVKSGVGHDSARSLATLIIAAIEGAIIIALATQSTDALDDVGYHLVEAIKLHLPATR